MRSLTKAMTMAAIVLAVASATSGAALAQRQPPPRQAAPVEGVVNINTATAGELVVLPGIGPGKAKAIVAYRSTHGAFHSVDELENVKGIGRKTLAHIKAHLTLSGPTTLSTVRSAPTAAAPAARNVPAP